MMTVMPLARFVIMAMLMMMLLMRMILTRKTTMRIRMVAMMAVVPYFPGAQDFLPDFESASRWYNVYRIYPKYGPLVSAMRKVKEWMHNARVSFFLVWCNFSLISSEH